MILVPVSAHLIIVKSKDIKNLCKVFISLTSPIIYYPFFTRLIFHKGVIFHDFICMNFIAFGNSKLCKFVIYCEILVLFTHKLNIKL